MDAIRLFQVRLPLDLYERLFACKSGSLNGEIVRRLEGSFERNVVTVSAPAKPVRVDAVGVPDDGVGKVSDLAFDRLARNADERKR